MFNNAAGSSKSKFEWLKDIEGTCLHGVSNDPPARTKVALFDLDGTLIRPQGGRKYPRNASDWEWWHSKVKRYLNQAYQDGYASAI